MELIGLGNDIIEIERIKAAIEKNKRFIERVFSPEEIEIVEKRSNPYNSYAGRFAAKEAVSKAFGTGIRDFNLNDIEILNDELGKPYVRLKNNLEEMYRGYSVMLSISHSKYNAVATAILYRK